jgi:hypothetical protein
MRFPFIAISIAGLLSLSTTAVAQSWTLEQPPPQQTFDWEETINGWGMAPGGDLSAEFTFEQDLPITGWTAWDTVELESETHMIGGVIFIIWQGTLDPANANGHWPLSRVDHDIVLPDYKTKITSGGYEAATLNHTVKDLP